MQDSIQPENNQKEILELLLEMQKKLSEMKNELIEIKQEMVNTNTENVKLKQDISKLIGMNMIKSKGNSLEHQQLLKDDFHPNLFAETYKRRNTDSSIKYVPTDKKQIIHTKSGRSLSISSSIPKKQSVVTSATTTSATSTSATSTSATSVD